MENSTNLYERFGGVHLNRKAHAKYKLTRSGSFVLCVILTAKVYDGTNKQLAEEGLVSIGYLKILLKDLKQKKLIKLVFDKNGKRRIVSLIK